MLVFTWHFKEEWDSINKPLEFVLEILDHGEHVLISKKQNKYNVFFPLNRLFLCLSYVEREDIILIHIKPSRKRIITKGK